MRNRLGHGFDYLNISFLKTICLRGGYYLLTPSGATRLLRTRCSLTAWCETDLALQFWH